MEQVDIRKILGKLRLKSNRINFLREAGMKFFNFLGFILPADRGFDGKFFLEVIKREKSVHIIIYFYSYFVLDSMGEQNSRGLLKVIISLRIT